MRKQLNAATGRTLRPLTPRAERKEILRSVATGELARRLANEASAHLDMAQADYDALVPYGKTYQDKDVLDSVFPFLLCFLLALLAAPLAFMFLLVLFHRTESPESLFWIIPTTFSITMVGGLSMWWYESKEDSKIESILDPLTRQKVAVLGCAVRRAVIDTSITKEPLIKTDLFVRLPKDRTERYVQRYQKNRESLDWQRHFESTISNATGQQIRMNDYTMRNTLARNFMGHKIQPLKKVMGWGW